MDRKNKYEILIELNKKSNSKIFEGQIDYLGSRSYQDYLLITQNLITIVAERSSKVNLSNIFYNHNSSLYNQIIKALAYYYCINKNFTEIQKISITRTRSLKKLDSKTLKKYDINQIIDSRFKLNSNFDPIKLEEIFSESEKGKMLLNSITYLLKANSAKDDYEKFERLWKSFNPLYRLVGKHPKEFDCLVATRTFISNNPNCFQYSLPRVRNIDSSELRLSLRWRAMIINNYPRESDTNNYRNSIIRCTDSRIMSVYLATIGNREQFLKNQGFYNQVKTHLDNHIQANTKVDTEVLAVLILRYMYFVRNKSFHGEKIDSTFRLTINKEIKEFKWLNKRLEPFIIDLINSNDKY